MRKKIVAGNWKMNNDLSETETLLSDLKEQVFPEEVEVIVAPAFPNLFHTFQSVREHPILVAAQNMNANEAGPYTGEVSAKMLKSVGVDIVILGHSERRAYFHETHDMLAEKVDTALKNDMIVIFCFGEELKDRKNEVHFDVVKAQVSESLFHLSEEAWENIVLAYEPVWAIGTGETATPEQAQEMHHYIRNEVAKKYTKTLADGISILYGGSVKPGNAKEIFAKKDVDGGLIGGASLKAADFMEIVNSFE